MAMQRNGLYRLLSSVFREEMTEDMLRHFLNDDFLRYLYAAGVNVRAFSSLKPNAESLDELSLEFTRLFIGPGKHVSPYESVHLGGDSGSLWGSETSAVKRFIEKSGFAYDKNYHDLPDHISVELEFMAHLIGLEADARLSGDSEKAKNSVRFQKEFLDRHLGRWIKLFSRKVEELANLPFYTEIAALTSDFVESESSSSSFYSFAEK